MHGHGVTPEINPKIRFNKSGGIFMKAVIHKIRLTG